jgi:hypothetical protein
MNKLCFLPLCTLGAQRCVGSPKTSQICAAAALVNEEFDFMLAMSMEDGLGAGLAAAKRKENNQKRAGELAELRLGGALEAKLEELCACGRDVYFVLWGREGKIKMVLDGKGAPTVADAIGTTGENAFVQRVEALLGGVDCE